VYFHCLNILWFKLSCLIEAYWFSFFIWNFIVEYTLILLKDLLLQIYVYFRIKEFQICNIDIIVIAEVKENGFSLIFDRIIIIDSYCVYLWFWGSFAIFFFFLIHKTHLTFWQSIIFLLLFFF